mmetsp:Transcript_68785/g.151523  ORF Transcript_68785/g.151523 Transcript_68785/m.151523 type:complete len:168 (+) Transcript_68785:115-618(+)
MDMTASSEVGTKHPFADQPPTSSQTWDQSSRGIKLYGLTAACWGCWRCNVPQFPRFVLPSDAFVATMHDVMVYDMLAPWRSVMCRHENIGCLTARLDWSLTIYLATAFGPQRSRCERLQVARNNATFRVRFRLRNLELRESYTTLALGSASAAISSQRNGSRRCSCS